MTKVEWSDVQGLILSGYPKLPKAAYILWQFVPGQPREAKGLAQGSRRTGDAGDVARGLPQREGDQYSSVGKRSQKARRQGEVRILSRVP